MVPASNQSGSQVGSQTGSHGLSQGLSQGIAAQSGASGVSGTGIAPRSGQREAFATEELAIVLSHFDIGIIDSIVEYPKGSRKAPKLLVITDQGKFLLKRRARGKDDPYKVAFSHSLQLYLASKQFPLPHLVGTKRTNNSMLQWRNSVYELFEYIPGQPYPQTLEATFESGRVLSLYHKLLLDFQSEWNPSGGSYHQAPAVEQGLRAIPKALREPREPADGNGDVVPLLEFLLESYQHAGQMVQGQGMDEWPRQIVHADWHPGNMLYRDNHVVAVIDYDSARVLPRIVDAANGALQFSILGGDEDVSKWPDYLDESRYKRFFRGYDGILLLSEAELRTVPWLMIEALIAESVFPIAATGTFGRMEGRSFLKMVRRKIQWMQQNADRLIELAAG